jgi:hypothetical protein
MLLLMSGDWSPLVVFALESVGDLQAVGVQTCGTLPYPALLGLEAYLLESTEEEYWMDVL